MRPPSPVIACLLLPGIAAPAAAQVPSTMTFPGVLTDDAGTLFPEGSYDLTFNIYDVASGGSALYSEAHPSVALVRGGFSVILGSTTPLTLPFDVPYWLGIPVGGGVELSPRVPLTSSPYARSLRLPFSGAGGDLTTPTLSLTNDVLGGNALKAKQQVTVEAGNGLDLMQLMSSEGPEERYNGITLEDPEILAELASRVQADGTRSSHLSLHRHVAADGVFIFSGQWNGAPVLPERLEFGPARPNPATGPVRFSLALPKEASVSLEVLDVQGRMGCTTWRGTRAACARGFTSCGSRWTGGRWRCGGSC